MLRGLSRAFSSVKDKIKKERAMRLGKIEESLPIKTNENLEKIRNIAIIAHIDAGKTSTTERMIFYSGALPEPGEVDEGTTVTDYLPQQRARGITIRSAAISFNWRDHQINLIDTPGHVDFSGEVARSLRVLDGVVTIFDAVHGVQTQTQKVWMQANRHELPKIAFINKMDRVGANVQHCLRTIKQRLQAQGLLLQLPIGEAQTFKGVVDLLSMQSVIFEGFRGSDVKRRVLTESDGLFLASKKARQELIEKVAEYDEKLADLYLQGDEITQQILANSIKNAICSPKHIDKLCAVLLGAAVKNRGVQPLLDGIISYLPSPSERKPIVSFDDPKLIRKPLKKQPFCGYVFKIIYDKEKGPLHYVRVYSGTLARAMSLKNATKDVIEKIQFLYRVRADQYVLVQEVSAGDIVAIAGLKNTAAGDTLNSINDQKFLLEQLKLPAAIFMAPFEVESIKDQQTLEQSLKTIVSEDNSLAYKVDSDTGQLVVSGLGQLHLQIVRDRLIESGVATKMGKLRIGYRETLAEPVKQKIRFEKLINKQELWFELELEVIPILQENEEFMLKNDVVVSFKRVPQFDAHWEEYKKRRVISKKKKQEDADDTPQVQADKAFGKVVRNPTKVEPIQNEDEDAPVKYHISTLSFDHLMSICEAIELNLLSGRYHYPLTSLQVHITDGYYQPLKINKMVISQACTKLLKQSVMPKTVLIEPYVDVELAGEEEMIEHAIKDIMLKRGRVEMREDRRVFAKVPAEGIRGWVKSLRAMGFDTLIKYSGYEKVQGISPELLLQGQ